MQEITTRRAFLESVLAEWSVRATWRGAVYGGAGFAALVVWKGSGGIRVAAIAALLGACLGALFALVLAAALRIASHPLVLSFWDRLGLWTTSPPDDFVPTHSLPCGRVRWPAKVEGGLLYLGVGRAAFVPYRHSILGRRVTLGPGVEPSLVPVAAVLHWLLPFPPYTLQLQDASQRVRFLVAGPTAVLPMLAAVLKGELAENERAAEQRVGADGRRQA